MSELDLKKLGRVIAMVGSDHEGEALTALRLADRMLPGCWNAVEGSALARA